MAGFHTFRSTSVDRPNVDNPVVVQGRNADGIMFVINMLMDTLVELDLPKAKLKSALSYSNPQIEMDSTCGSVPLAFLISECLPARNKDFCRRAIAQAKIRELTNMS